MQATWRCWAEPISFLMISIRILILSRSANCILRDLGRLGIWILRVALREISRRGSKLLEERDGNRSRWKKRVGVLIINKYSKIKYINRIHKVIIKILKISNNTINVILIYKTNCKIRKQPWNNRHETPPQ